MPASCLNTTLGVHLAELNNDLKNFDWITSKGLLLLDIKISYNIWASTFAEYSFRAAGMNLAPSFQKYLKMALALLSADRATVRQWVVELPLYEKVTPQYLNFLNLLDAISVNFPNAFFKFAVETYNFSFRKIDCQ